MTFDLPPAWRIDTAVAGADTVVAGVDIGGTQCSVNVATCRDGVFELVARDQFPTRAERGPDPVIAEIEERLRMVGRSRSAPQVVGISCGGPLDSATGTIQSPPNLPGWDDIAITGRLSNAVGVRCVLENDANACAVAEWAFGAGRGIDDLVYLTFGTGLGAGLILDGVPYRGVGDLAGEVGHWRLGPDVGPLHYGKRGSFEGYCSGSGIVEWYRYLGEGDEADAARSDTALSAEVIAGRARQGEARARRVFDQAARQLGRGIALIVDALAPEVIVLGGMYVYARDLLEEGMWTTLSAEAHPQLSRGCRVVPAVLGREVGSYASCGIALSDLAGGLSLGRRKGRSVAAT